MNIIFTYALTHTHPSVFSIEIQEIEIHKAMLAKKRPGGSTVNPRVMQSMGEMGVPKVNARPLTEPKPFNLRVDSRAANASKPTRPEFQRPRRVMPNAKDQAAPVKKQLTLTVPSSPKLSSKMTEAAKIRQAEIESARQEKLKAAKGDASSSKPTPSLKSTAPKAFNFLSDQRGAIHKQVLQTKIQKEEEKLSKSAVRSVSHVPNFSKTMRATSAVSKRSCTEFEEFSLQSLSRHEMSVHQLSKNVEQQLIKEKKEHNFHAQPVAKKAFTKPREVPKSTRKPLQVISPNFQSEKRADRRKSFERKLKESTIKKELEKKSLMSKQHDEENHNINILRRKSIAEGGLMFKANPIITDDKFPTAKPIMTPLTEPKSPMLRTALRAPLSSLKPVKLA